MTRQWAGIVACCGLLACGPTQPDVSAHTFLTLLVQTEGQADVLPITLGALYETVKVSTQSGSKKPTSITIDLGRDDRLYANLRCDTFSTPVPDDFDLRIMVPFMSFGTAFGDLTKRRVICRLTYFDNRKRVTAFLEQAEMWATANLGPVQATEKTANFTWKTVTSPDRHQSIAMALAGTGRQQNATVIFLNDLP